jgi:hypothetical protein
VPEDHLQKDHGRRLGPKAAERPRERIRKMKNRLSKEKPSKKRAVETTKEVELPGIQKRPPKDRRQDGRRKRPSRIGWRKDLEILRWSFSG